MPEHAQLGLIIPYLFPTAEFGTDYIVRSDGEGQTPYLAFWNLGPEPTQQEIDDAAASQGFLDYALDRSDPSLSKRRKARGYLDSTDPAAIALRSLAEVLLKEINVLRTIHLLPPRTLAQAKTAIQVEIDTGDQDV